MGILNNFLFTIVITKKFLSHMSIVENTFVRHRMNSFADD